MASPNRRRRKAVDQLLSNGSLFPVTTYLLDLAGDPFDSHQSERAQRDEGDHLPCIAEDVRGESEEVTFSRTSHDLDESKGEGKEEPEGHDVSLLSLSRSQTGS